MIFRAILQVSLYYNIVHHVSAISPSQDFMNKANDQDLYSLRFITNIKRVGSNFLEQIF